MYNFQFQKGFTLIELFIVVAIIAILAVIAIPSYIIVVDKGYSSACLSEAKAYSNEVFYFLNDDYVDTLPQAPTINACETITNATGWTLDTWNTIEATAKLPSNAHIECDIPNGTPCRILP